jgi:hypothetical protein
VLRISPLTPQSNNAANPEAREADGWLSWVVSVVKREARVRPIEGRERALVRQGHVRRTQPPAAETEIGDEHVGAACRLTTIPSGFISRTAQASRAARQMLPDAATGRLSN